LGGAGGSGGKGVHAASSRISANLMWVIYVEILLALGLAVFIVWWTWPKKRRDKNGGADQ